MSLKFQTQVLIVGGGATGTGLARDLALRGVHCILAEKGDINAGASGSNHGLLHSGARYVSTDPAVARECREENVLLKRLVPHCIEDTGGLFVAIEGDDERYVADFPHMCARCGIPVNSLDISEALELEPALSEKVIAAYQVEDASIDPFKLSLENSSQAQELGSKLLQHTKIVEFKKSRNRIESAHLKDTKTGEEIIVEPEQVVNACGAWAGEVAALAGVSIDIIYSKGSLLVTDRRITKRVVNRLRSPADGDILVPGGTVSILGTTSMRIDSLEQVRPTVAEIDLIVEEGAAMLPVMESARYIRAYAGVRPLLKPESEANDRSVSRGFTLLDHIQDGIENFATIPGGKLTTYRFMAEKTADLVCKRMGITDPCLTRTEPLPSTPAGMWTEPGLGPRLWIKGGGPENHPLCECEILPKSVIDSVIGSIQKQGDELDLRAIGLRSRMGKGSCQGTFCGERVTAHLYERGDFSADEGLTHLKSFLRERWKGERLVLWDAQLIQAEFKEALYCGLLGLES
ncbi:MAG: anaerobic glycerol-3-phosphate dehydrogenase subunit A [Thermodesulfobacteriota bacterium]|nr:anaerobic glycerol-3-phosphate dehydrogenase subunit A [Thermodesulfobacteriota bacterium]